MRLSADVEEPAEAFPGDEKLAELPSNVKKLQKVPADVERFLAGVGRLARVPPEC